jgi:2-methylcitrate dehydratase PrpD
MNERPGYLAEIARFACNAQVGDLGTRALERTRWVIADSLPVIAAGMQQPEMQAFVQKHLAAGGGGLAWVVGTRRRASPLNAALLNGTAGTWLELDEGNLLAKGHPGIQVVPAAIALAHERGSPGAEVVMAVALGYEISSRISRAARIKLSVHPHGTWGVLGAAIAAGRLKKFDEAQMVELLNVASTMGMATSRQTLLDGSTVRNIFTGHAGFMGLLASRLVECSFTGEVDSPSSVFGKVLGDDFDPAKVTENLGTEWMVADGYFKLHPTGRYVHSAIDALEDLLSRVPGGKVNPASIERIEVRTYKLAAMLAELRVKTSFGARFSVPFALASILHHGGSGLLPFEQAAVDNEAIQALAARVDLKEDLQYTARYPKEQVCDLKITLAEGKVLEGRCLVMKGEPANPHTHAELEAKFLQLGVPVWGEETSRRLLDGCMKLETLPDFGAFADGLNL